MNGQLERKWSALKCSSMDRPSVSAEKVVKKHINVIQENLFIP
jgi:hypothetical protein